MYAKEHFRPQLHQLDQDKLARLYADLRRESLATGSFPITVRHLESMIRMAEASAKMHLREYVRSDDIDLAIQVAVGSFVNAQKMSIKKTLERVSFTFWGLEFGLGLTTGFLGLPKICSSSHRSRRTPFLPFGWHCQGKGPTLPPLSRGEPCARIYQGLTAPGSGKGVGDLRCSTFPPKQVVFY